MPTWRRDIAIEADVAEEIARVRGYELVPSVTPDTEMPHFRPSPLEVRELVRDTLAGAGLTEVVTTALVSPATSRRSSSAARSRPIGDEDAPGGDPIGVGNPLSRDHSVLRRNLLGSLLDVVGGNLRHGTADVAVFEIGKGYARTGDEPREWWRLGFALVGAAEAPAWNRAARPYDLDDAKGVLELLATRLGLGGVAYEPERDEPLFHPGRTARARCRGTAGGHRRRAPPGHRRRLGAAHDRPGHRSPRSRSRGSPRAGWHRSGRLPSAASPRWTATSPSSSPRRRRAAAVEAVIRAHGGELLRGVALFDIYRGVPLAASEKSLAYRLRLGAPDRTLTEPEVEAAVGAVVAALPAVEGRIRLTRR